MTIKKSLTSGALSLKKRAYAFLHKVSFPLIKYFFTSRNKPFILTTYVFLLFAEIIFIASNSDLKYFGLVGLFIVISLFYKLSSKITFGLCLLLLSIMYISFIASLSSPVTEKAAVFIVLFMIVGIIQQWIE